jgi:transposase InsO family protein
MHQTRQFRRKQIFPSKVQRSNYNIKFEFTAPGTPQQNVKVERAFTTLYCKTRSMLNSARLTATFRQGLWESCASLAVQLEKNHCQSEE